MSAKKGPVKKVLVKIDDLCIERLAVDLLRYMISNMRSKDVVMPRSTLPENKYPSATFIEDIALPALLYSMVLRDRLRIKFEGCSVFEKGDRKAGDAVKGTTNDGDKAANVDKTEEIKVSKDKDEQVTEDGKTAGDEENGKVVDYGAKITHDLSLLYDVFVSLNTPDTFKELIISLAICYEFIAYLGYVDKGDLVEYVPGVWLKIFKIRILEKFKASGDFTEYLSYWGFLRDLKHHIFRFVKNFENYETEQSNMFTFALADIPEFSEDHVLEKIFNIQGGPEGCADYFKTVKALGFYPHDKFVKEIEAAGGIVVGKPKHEVCGTGSKGPVKRVTKVKAKAGQTWSRYMAQRRAAAKEARDKEKQEKELDRLAENVERKGQLSESEEEENS